MVQAGPRRIPSVPEGRPTGCFLRCSGRRLGESLSWVSEVSLLPHGYGGQQGRGTGVGAAQGLWLWPCSQYFVAPPAGKMPNCTWGLLGWVRENLAPRIPPAKVAWRPPPLF